MEGWVDREKKRGGRIKDLHSKANTTTERDYSAEETVPLKRREREAGGVAAGRPSVSTYRLCWPTIKKQLCFESCGSEESKCHEPLIHSRGAAFGADADGESNTAAKNLLCFREGTKWSQVMCDDLKNRERA